MSALALLKIAMHARSGGQLEVRHRGAHCGKQWQHPEQETAWAHLGKHWQHPKQQLDGWAWAGALTHLWQKAQ